MNKVTVKTYPIKHVNFTTKTTHGETRYSQIAVMEKKNSTRNRIFFILEDSFIKRTDLIPFDIFN